MRDHYSSCTKILYVAFSGIVFCISILIYNSSAFTSLIGEKVREGERSLPYSFIASGGQVGLLIVGSAGSYIGVAYTWDYLFQLIGMLSLCWVYTLYKMDKSYRTEIYDKAELAEKAVEAERPDLCRKAVIAMMITHLTSNNCFFIMFNWLPAYFHSHWPEQSPSIYSSIPWSLRHRCKV